MRNNNKSSLTLTFTILCILLFAATISANAKAKVQKFSQTNELRHHRQQTTKITFSGKVLTPEKIPVAYADIVVAIDSLNIKFNGRSDASGVIEISQNLPMSHVISGTATVNSPRGDFLPSTFSVFFFAGNGYHFTNNEIVLEHFLIYCRMSGKIIRKDNKQGVKGAFINVEFDEALKFKSHESISDISGNFVITEQIRGSLPSLSVRITVTDDSYNSFTKSYTLLSEKEFSLEGVVIELEAKQITGSIRGQVQDMLGAVIPNATVNITFGEQLYTTFTDAKGTFLSYIPNIARGLTYEGLVSVTADGKDVTSVPYTVQENFLYNTQVIVTLRERLAQGFIYGLVTDKDGKILKNVYIEVFIDGKVKGSQNSDENGEFNIKVTVGEGKQIEGRVKASLEDFVTAEGSFVLKPDFNYNTGVTVKLFRQVVEGLITGTLKLDSGEPLSSGKISYRHVQNENIAGESFTDSFGKFAIKVANIEKGLSHGIVLSIREEEHLDPVELRVSLTPSANYTYNYDKEILISRQKALARIVGRIVGENGQPISGAEIGFWQAGSRTHISTVNNAGEFSFEFEASKGLVYKGEVQIQLDTYQKGVKEVFLDVANNYNFNTGDIILKFQRQAITVKGVLRELNGEVIPNLSLTFRSNELEISGKTDVLGAFSLSLNPKVSDVHIGTLLIEDKDQDNFLRETTNCVFHQENNFVFVLEKVVYRRFLDITVKGAIVDDRTKEPLSNVFVNLQIKNPSNLQDGGHSVQTDSQGRYSLQVKNMPGLLEIVAEIRASAENYMERVQTITFNRENKYVLSNVDFSLIKERLIGKINLRIIDESSQVLVGASATARILSPISQIQSQNSDGNGKVILSMLNLEKGVEYSGQLEIIMKHKISQNISISISKSNNYNIELGDILLKHVRVQASYTGKVVDSKATPLSGVLVLLSDNTAINTTTNSEGSFNLLESNLLEGKQYSRTLRLHLTNFQPELLKATVDLSNEYKANTGVTNLKREIIKGAVSGTVQNEAGQSLSGAKVVIHLPLGTRLAEIETSESGTFSIEVPNLEKGLVYQGEVEIKAPGKLPEKRVVNLLSSNEYNDTIGVVKLAFVKVEGNINGIAQDSRGNLLANATVIVFHNEKELLRAVSSNQGVFDLRGTFIQEQVYDLSLRITLVDFDSYNTTAKLSQENLHRVKLGVITLNRLVQNVILTGKVTNEEDKPLSDIVITVTVLEDPTLYSVRTDESGVFRLQEKVKSKEIIGATVGVKDPEDWYVTTQREVGFHDGNQYTVELSTIVLAEKYVKELTIEGTVRDSSTNSTIENANVTIIFDSTYEQKRFTFLTLEKGLFSFVFSKVLKKSEYKADILISHPYYKSQAGKVALNKENQFKSQIPVFLARTTVSLEHSGSVVDENNKPLPNATIILIVHGLQPKEFLTNTDGKYSFSVPNLFVGENYYGKLSVTHPLCEIPTNLPRIFANTSNNYSSSLTAPIKLIYKKTLGTITGQVVGFQSKPLEASSVELLDSNGNSLESIKTDASGRFSFEKQILALPAVIFRIRVVADEYKLSEREAILRDTTNWNLDLGTISLNPLKTIVEVSIEALLVDELTKAPVQGADYEILLPASYQAITGQTAENGRISAKSVLKDMTVIPIELLITHNNGKYLPIKKNIELNDANNYSANIEKIELLHVTRELTVEGVLRREGSNEIIPNAVVGVERQGLKVVELFTDSQGRFIYYDPSVISQITHVVNITFSKQFYFNNTLTFNLSRSLNQFSIKNMTVFLKKELVTVSVKGLLLDEEKSLRPFIGGNVSLMLNGLIKRVITTSTGEFNIAFPDLEKGNDYHLLLKITSKNKNTFKRNITASLNENNYQIDLGNITISHELVDSILMGKIIGSDSNLPIEGVQVINELNKALQPNVTSNEQGQFKLSYRVKKGEQSSVFLRFLKRHYLLVTKIVELNMNNNYSQYLEDIVLERIQRDGKISGKVVDEHKSSINGSIVTVTLGTTTKEDTTDINGDFQIDFTKLYEGPDYPITLSIVKEDYISAEQSLTLSLNSSYSIDLKQGIILKRQRVQGQIRGRVVDQLKNPVPGVRASVSTSYTDEKETSVQTVSDTNGIFVLNVEALKNLEQLTTVRLLTAGYAEKSIPVILSPNNSYQKDIGDIEYSSINITLTYTARILSYGTMKPIPNLDFVFKPVHGEAFIGRSDETGLINISRNLPRTLEYSGLIRITDNSRVIATYERSASFNLTNNYAIYDGEILLEPEFVVLSISGKVHRNDTNEGVEGANVGILLEENLETMSRFSVQTDSQGSFKLEKSVKSGKNYEIKLFAEKNFFESSAPFSRLVNKTNNYTAGGVEIVLLRKKVDGLISLSVEEENGPLKTPAELKVLFESGETIIAKSDNHGLIKVPIKGLDLGEIYKGNATIHHPFKHLFIIPINLNENNNYTFVLIEKIVLKRVRVNGTIAGLLRDKYRGEPVAGASVEISTDLGTFNTTSTSTGNFSVVIPNLDQELRVQGQIKISQLYFETMQLVILLNPENNHNVIIDSLLLQHLKKAAKLFGKIIDQRGRQVKDAKLQFQINGFSALQETGSDGSFESTPILNNGMDYNLTLVISKDGHDNKEIALKLTHTSNFTMDFGTIVLNKKIEWQEVICKGRLMDPLNNPIVGLNVTLSIPFDKGVHAISTDETGSFFIKAQAEYQPVINGQVNITDNNGLYRRSDRKVAFYEGNLFTWDLNTITLILDKVPVSITGRVVDAETTNPLEGVKVNLQFTRENGSIFAATPLTSSDGMFVANTTTAGHLEFKGSLNLTPEFYEPQTFPFLLLLSEKFQKNLIIKMQREKVNFTVEGSVVGENQEGLGQVEVTLSLDSDPSRHAKVYTHKNGHFKLVLHNLNRGDIYNATVKFRKDHHRDEYRKVSGSLLNNYTVILKESFSLEQLGTNGAISIQLKNESNFSLPNISVELFRDGALILSNRTQENGNLLFLLDLKQGMDYGMALRIKENNYEPLTLTFDLNISNNYSVSFDNLILKRVKVQLSVAGNLRGEDGRIPQTTLVELSVKGQELVQGSVDDKGRFVVSLPNLNKGDVYIGNVTLSGPFKETVSLPFNASEENGYSVEIMTNVILRFKRYNATISGFINSNIAGVVANADIEFNLTGNLGNNPLSSNAVDLGQSVTKFSVKSDSNGYFQITQLLNEGSSYVASFAVTHENYEPAKRAFSLNHLNNYSKNISDIVLKRRLVVLTVRGFVFGEEEMSLKNVNVSLTLNNFSNQTFSESTEKGGRFSILVPEKHKGFVYEGLLHVSLINRDNITIPVSLGPHNSYSLEFKESIKLNFTRARARILGRIIAENGSAIENAEVDIYRGEEKIFSAITGPSGEFTFTNVLNASLFYREVVKVRALFYKPLEQTYSLHQENNYTANLSLVLSLNRLSGTIKGRIVDKDLLRPVSGVSVSLLLQGSDGFNYSSNTSDTAGGQFSISIPSLRETITYNGQLSFSSPSSNDHVQSVTLSYDNTYLFDMGVVHLIKKDVITEIRGLVTDKESKPLRGIAVTLLENFEIKGEMLTDVNGSYSFIFRRRAQPYEGEVILNGKYINDKRLPYHLDETTNFTAVVNFDNVEYKFNTMTINCKGKLIDEKGSPVVDREVILNLPSSQDMFIFRTLANGDFNFHQRVPTSPVASGIVSIEDPEEYFVPISEKVAFYEGNLFEYDIGIITLREKIIEIIYSGLLLEKNTLTPAPSGINLTLMIQNHTANYSAVSDAEGKFKLQTGKKLLSGYNYSASIFINSSFVVPLTLDNLKFNRFNKYQIDLEKVTVEVKRTDLEVYGRLIDETGEPLAGRLISANIMGLGLRASTNSTGDFIIKVTDRLRGFEYEGVIAYFEDHRNEFNVSYFGSESAGYLLNLGNVTLARKIVDVIVSTVFKENRTKELLEGVVVQVKTVAFENRKNPKVILDHEITTDKSGLLQIKLEGKSGLRYDTHLNISKRYFQNESFILVNQDSNNYSTNINETLLERNLVLGTIAGSVVDGSFNQNLTGVIIDVFVLSPIPANYTNISASNEGGFLRNVTLEEGLNYTFDILVNRENYDTLAVRNLTLSGANNHSVNLPNLVLANTKRNFTVKGQFKDLHTKETLQNVSYSFDLLSELGSTVLNGNSDANGSFSITGEILEPLNYNFTLRGIKPFYHQKARLGHLNLTNDYSFDLGTIRLDRLDGNFELFGSVQDSMFNNSISGAQIKAVVSSQRGVLEFSAVTKHDGTYLIASELEHHVNYTVNITVTMEHFVLNQTVNNVFFNQSLALNHTLTLNRRLVPYHITGKLFDNISLIRIANGSLELFIESPVKISVPSLKSLETGLFEFKGELPDGVNYSAKLNGSSIHHLLDTISLNLNLTNSYTKNLGLLNMYRKTAPVKVFGAIADKHTSKPLNFSTVSLTLRPSGNLTHLPSVSLSVVNNSLSEFSLEGIVQSGVKYIVDTNISRQYYNNFHSNSSKALFSKNYSVDMGIITLDKTPKLLMIEVSNLSDADLGDLIDGAVVLLNIHKNGTLEQYKVSSKLGNFSAVTDGYEGEEYSAYIQISKEHYNSVTVENILLNEANNHTTMINNIKMNRTRIQGQLTGRVELKESIALSNVSVSVSITDNKTNNTLNLLTQSDNNGDYNLTFTAFSGLLYNANLKIEKQYFASQHVYNVTLDNQNKFSSVIKNITLGRQAMVVKLSGSIYDRDTRLPIDNAEILVRIQKNQSLEVIRVHSKEGNFAAITGGEAGLNYYGVVMIGLTHYKTLTMENLTFTDENQHTIHLNNITLSRIEAKPRFSGKISDADGGALSNVSVGFYINSSQTNMTLNHTTTSDENGLYAYEFDGFSGFTYEMYFNYDKQYYISQTKNSSLNNENNFTLSTLDITLNRKPINLTITGTLWDPVVSKLVQNGSALLNIVKKQTPEELVYYSNENGYLNIVTSGFSGLSYGASVIIEKNHFNIVNLTGLILNEANNHTINLTTINMSRIEVVARVSGRVKEADGQNMSNVTVGLSVINNETNDTLNLTTATDEFGKYSLNFSGYSGFLYSPVLTFGKKYYISQTIVNQTIENKNNFNLDGVSLILNRIPVYLNLNGYLRDSVTGKMVKNADILMRVKKNGNFEDFKIKSGKGGIISAVSGGFDGFSYFVTISISKHHYHPVNIENLTLDEGNAYSVNISEISINRIPILASISGGLLNADGGRLSNATVDIEISNNETEQTINATLLSNENGTYSYNFSGYSGFRYLANLKFNKQYYVEQELLNRTLNNDNDFTFVARDIALSRIPKRLNITASLWDRSLNQSLLSSEPELLAELSEPETKSIVVNLVNNTITINESIKDGFNYSGRIIVSGRNLYNITVPFLVSSDGNYSQNLGLVQVDRRDVHFSINGSLEDSLNIPFGGASATLNISDPLPQIINADGNADGTFSLAGIVKQGLNYSSILTLTQLHLSPSLNYTLTLSPENNYTILLPNIKGNRRQVPTHLSGIVIENNTAPVAGAKIKLYIEKLNKTVVGQTSQLGYFNLTAIVGEGFNFLGTVKVIKTDFNTVTLNNITLSGVLNAHHDLNLIDLDRKEQTIGVDGSVYDLETTLPKPNCTVKITVVDHLLKEHVNSTQTDEQGIFRLSLPKIGLAGYNYVGTISITAEDFETRTSPIWLNSSNQYLAIRSGVKLVRMGERFHVYGTLNSNMGIPFNNHLVTLTVGNVTYKTNTTVEGDFDLSGMIKKGLVYQSSINYSGPHIASINGSSFVLNDDMNYKLNLGDIIGIRSKVVYMVSGYVLEKDKNISVSHPKISINITSPYHYPPAKVTADRSGTFRIMHEVYRGLNYSADVHIERDHFKGQITRGIFLNEANEYSYILGALYLSRLDQPLIINGTLIDITTQEPVYDAEITLTITQPELLEPWKIHSNEKGEFNIETDGLRGLTYTVHLQVKKEDYYIFKRENLTIDAENGYRLALNKVYIERVEDSYTIQGYTYENDIPEPLPNVSVSLVLKSPVKRTLIINSAKNGLFIFNDLKKKGLKYEADLVFEEPQLAGPVVKSISFTGQNDSMIEMGHILLPRREMPFTVFGRLVDSDFNEGFVDASANLVIDQLTLKPNVFNVYSVQDGYFEIKGFMQFGRNYTGVIKLLHQHMINHLSANVILNNENNFTQNLSTFYGQRLVSLLRVTGNLLELDYNDWPYANANISLQIKTPKPFNLTTVTNTKGYFELNDEVKLGIIYSGLIAIEHRDFKEPMTRNLTFAIENNYIRDLDTIYISRKDVKLHIKGKLQDEDEAIGIQDAFMTINFTEPKLNAFEKPIKLFTTHNGVFEYERDAKAGANYVVDIEFSKEHYTLVKQEQLVLSEANNYTLDLDVVFMPRKSNFMQVFGRVISANENGFPLENATISVSYQRLGKNDSQVVSMVTVGTGQFNIHHRGYEAITYMANIVIKCEYFEDFVKDNVQLSQENFYIVDLGDVSLKRKKAELMLMGSVVDAVSGANIGEADVTVDFMEGGQNRTIKEKTQRNGYFGLTNVLISAGLIYRVQVTVVKTQFNRQTVEVDIGPDTGYVKNMGQIRMTTNTIELYVTGKVLDKDTKWGVLGTLVTLNVIEGFETVGKTNFTTDPSGFFELKFPVTEGKSYKAVLSFETKTYDTHLLTLPVDPSQEYSVNLGDVLISRRLADIKLSGRVIDYDSGNALIDAEVTLQIIHPIIKNLTSAFSTYDGIFNLVDKIPDGDTYKARMEIKRHNYVDTIEEILIFTPDTNYTMDIGMRKLSKTMTSLKVKGRVVEDINESPIPNARVIIEIPPLQSHMTSTIETGDFTLAHKIHKGERYLATIRISSDDFFEQKVEGVSLHIGNNYQLDLGTIKMSRRSINVAIGGRVLDMETNEVIRDAQIIFTFKEPFDLSGTGFTEKSDWQGRFLITKEVKKGLIYKGSVKVASEAFQEYENDVIVLSNLNSYTINLQDIKLVRKRIIARVFGQLIDSSANKPLEGADVKFLSKDGYKIPEAKSDSNGAFDISFEIKEGFPVTGTLSAQKADTSGITIENINLTSGNKYTYDCGKLRVSRNEVDIIISGTVVDAAFSKNLHDVRVSLFLGGAPLKEAPEQTTIFTDLAGRFTFRGKGFIGLDYKYSMEIKKDYFHDFYSYGNNLNRENKYQNDFGKIELTRKNVKLTINGQVNTFETKSPLQGALIKLTVNRPNDKPLVVNQESTVSGDFLFNVDGFESYVYTCEVEITNQEYSDKYRRTFNLTMRNEYSVNLGIINLARQLKTMLITGIVVSLDGNTPIPKAEVSLGFALPSETYTTTVSTDENGRFKVEQKVSALGAVPVVIIVNAPSHHESRRSILLEPLNQYTQDVEIQLRKEGVVETLIRKKQIIRGRVIAKYDCPQLPTNEIPLNAVVCEFYVVDQFNAEKLYHISASSTTTDMFGMFDMQAPLTWEGGKEDPSSYQAFVILKHKGFQIDKIEVLIGGRTWKNEINLGTVRINHSKFGALPCPDI